MTKRAEDFIPRDIQEAAKAAGLSTPLWYVGRSNGHENKKLETGLGAAVQRGRNKARLGAARLVEPTAEPDSDQS